MSRVIIDTNVAVEANRQNSTTEPRCVEACIGFLIDARNYHVVLIDSGNEIRKEYARALGQSRPYQLGAQFLFYIYQNQWDTKRVRRVELKKTKKGDFVDFPNVAALETFDPSDRKFAALAKRTGTAVTNATDSDWVAHRKVLKDNGIDINFLCGVDKSDWYTK